MPGLKTASSPGPQRPNGGSMSFADRLATAITEAHPSQFDHLARAVWKAVGADQLTWDKAGTLSEAIEARRADRRTAPLTGAHRSAQAKPWSPSIFPPRREQPARRHPERIERRETLAFSGVLPPALLSGWTMARMAILRIVGDEVRDQGACELTLAEIAARAGTCRTMARMTLRQAAERGLVLIEERRRPGMKNLPNRVRIISAEWRTWLKRGLQNAVVSVLAALEAIGGKRTPPTDTDLSLIAENRTKPKRKNGFGEKRRPDRPVPPD